MRLQIVAALLSLVTCVSLATAEGARAPRAKDLRIDARKVRAPEAGAGVVVLSMRRAAAGGGIATMTFARTTAQGHKEGESREPVADPEIYVMSKGGRGKNDSRVRDYSAWQAPPGRYAMALFIPVITGTTHPGRQYCFGTIGFDLAAGEVLYVGDYVAAGVADPALAFDLDDARRALGTAPDLQQRVRPAQMLEGLAFECNWADMAQYKLTAEERAMLIAAGAIPPPPAPVAAPTEAVAPTTPAPEATSAPVAADGAVAPSTPAPAPVAPDPVAPAVPPAGDPKQ